MQNISVEHKKRGRPATGKNPIAGVRLPDDIRMALFRVQARKNIESQSETVRVILSEWLKLNGFLP